MGHENISTHSLTRRLTPFWAILHLHKDISTHSLTRRLTKSFTQLFSDLDISTHSLTRRLTSYARIPPEAYEFQLTASQGG